MRLAHPVYVIFLDIDGVLNSETHLRRLDQQHRQLGHRIPYVLSMRRHVSATVWSVRSTVMPSCV